MKTKSRLSRWLVSAIGISGMAAALLVAGPAAASAEAAVKPHGASAYCRAVVPAEETIALCGQNKHAKWAIGIDADGGWESSYLRHVDEGDIFGWSGTFLTPEAGDIGISLVYANSGSFVVGTVRPEVASVLLVTDAGKQIPLRVGPDVRPDHFRYAGTWIEGADDGPHEMIGYNAAGEEVARHLIEL